MRPNVKLIISFEEFEELINVRARGTIPNIHITSASCDNDRGGVVLSAIDMRCRPLRGIELATSVPFFAFTDTGLQRRETREIHKCHYMPDGYILRKSRGGDWFYCHLGDSQPIVEFCPHCGLKLEV